MTQRITLLGSTGSIGKSTLDVVARHPDRYSVHALSAQRNWEALAAQCAVFRPAVAVIGSADAAAPLRDALRRHGLTTEVAHGPDALCDIASAAECDTVVAAIVGAAGLPSALAAARTGKRILLANKEALVMSGALFMAAVKESGATLLPLDSEHNAIFQCLPSAQQAGTAPMLDPRGGIEKIILTASGGPFRTRDPLTLANVTPDQACAHPNWVMGRKISVDSATMMNKGLEVIEAHWLFGLPPSRIDVLIHPQSVIHSMVSYADGSVLAELGNPDMRTPIAHALAYPDRIGSGVAPLDLAAIGQLQFEKPDLGRFPCLRLAFASLRQGGTASAAMNAANEIAVDAFLAGQLRFTDIATVVEAVMNAMTHGAATRLEDVFAADEAARSEARARLEGHRWHH
ncbi:1-deoxy-D-xylulose 5-phosphate reductoisomerase [Robbsia andropogonis]|uniref:1-deoxy-D-xylulose 5-phosphate reductoisomerase n=1 Tax=Robbsia andropogonis TaxID=28092 RepID=A0A0F5JZE6_9BURK|nr:1-deoxy-D-xylulose-5-phosphate reductoisomerase [Robbsia andropogonis]KKB63198.1 1-deoxy-D-xylulose 5-phosphate reductoisomerase [Robbsia andropogonis]MCP1117618.1 1-deoxy-D-xylulose-5-phosphate reductoisomerase [Robbsia andropogonis]MCP1127084.1 1-deoxy-D-xylulose-5-phosphate reductoisomerase [Robbsia andropogonis]